MAIPDYQDCMLPLLKSCADDQEHSISEFYDRLSESFCLTEEERSERVASGQQTKIANRISWAKTYLLKAGLILNPSRGTIRISEEGKNVLAQLKIVHDVGVTTIRSYQIKRLDLDFFEDQDA